MKKRQLNDRKSGSKKYSTSKRVILIFLITLLLLSVTSCDLMLN